MHVRTYDPVNDRFKYTAAGKLWVAAHPVDYVPLIPVRVETLRRSGAVATYMGYYPLANLPQEIDNALLRAQRTCRQRAPHGSRSGEESRSHLDAGKWNRGVA